MTRTHKSSFSLCKKKLSNTGVMTAAQAFIQYPEALSPV